MNCAQYFHYGMGANFPAKSYRQRKIMQISKICYLISKRKSFYQNLERKGRVIRR